LPHTGRTDLVAESPYVGRDRSPPAGRYPFRGARTTCLPHEPPPRFCTEEPSQLPDRVSLAADLEGFVESRTNPGRWLVIPDLIHAIHDLDPLHRAPTGHEGARERYIREADREGIIHHASCARWGRGPPIDTAICIEPCVHLIEAVAESFGRNADPDPHGPPSGDSRLTGLLRNSPSTPSARYDHFVNQRQGGSR
jgi:hypothetical protein